ncbi:MAG: alpha/beta hydrolase [Actinomycetota bacterium]
MWSITGRRSRWIMTVLVATTLLGVTAVSGWHGAAGAVGARSDRQAMRQQFRVVSGIQYIQDGNSRHTLDVYYPAFWSYNKVLVFVHGGGLSSGDKADYAELGKTYAGLYHYTTVLVNYELSLPNGTAVHPDHIEDVAAAFAWVKAHIGEYYGDPGEIFLLGQSAGAYLVSLLATDIRYLQAEGCSRSDIEGVISLSGYYDLYDYTVYPDNPLGLTEEQVQMFRTMIFNSHRTFIKRQLDNASPYWKASSTQPQFCVMRTENDMPGLDVDAWNFYTKVDAFAGQNPDFFVLQLSDYSEDTWAWSVLSATSAGFDDEATPENEAELVAGHWAEVASMNPTDALDPEHDTSIETVVDFIESH